MVHNQSLLKSIEGEADGKAAVSLLRSRRGMGTCVHSYVRDSPVPTCWCVQKPITVILQIFGVVLFSVFSVVIGFTEIKKTPKWDKYIE